MGTSWAGVVTDDAMLVINDLRLKKELEEDPALFFRKMAFYMRQAVPRFNRPPEMKEWLTFTEPTFDSVTATAQEEHTSDWTVETGAAGYDLVSVGTMTQDVYGNPVYTPFPRFSYERGTGALTLHAAPDEPIAEGTVFSVDMYADGTFDHDLTAAQRRILALCLQYVWETAFVNDWLNRAPRASDRSFNAGNVANSVRVNTERLNSVKRILDDELAKYEQDCAYMLGVKKASGLV